MKYKCLFLDHDDTSVNSTPSIHYKAHLEVIKKMRPHVPPLSLDEWFKVNFEPGIMAYMTDMLGMDDKEISEEYDIWRRYTSTVIPDFFPGLVDILAAYKAAGGIVVVVSHSEVDLIERDYLANNKKTGRDFFPDMIFGWTYDANKRKPHPWPVITALEKYGISPEESLILDDLKPGVIMGKTTGVKTAAAGWSYNIPEIRSYMTEHCVSYFETVKDFGDYLLS